jgi:hypothetical protein
MKKTVHNIGVFLNHKLFLIAIICGCLYTLGTLSDRQFGWTNKKNTKSGNLTTIHTDGSGYYAYLPQWFIYNKQQPFHFINKITKKYNTLHFESGLANNKQTKQITNKYYTGTAVCIAPVFLINHAINLLMYGEGDGYSKSYQLSVAIAALLYWLLGIIGFIKIARLFDASNFSIALVITAISVGTNLNFYTSYYSSFSHVYSFFAVTWFLYFSIKWAGTFQNKYMYFLSLTLGLIFIIRPVNIAIAFIIPFLFIDWKTFIKEIKHFIKNKKLPLITSLFLFLTPLFFHFTVKLIESNSFSFNSYSDEGFDFLFTPKIFEVLFSYKKGFFTYGPIMFLIIPGLFYFYKQKKYLFLGWSIVCVLFIYITSSWWCWWYGGGHGMRPFIDYMSVFALPILIFINNISKFKKFLVVVFSICMIYFYQTLQFQFNNCILKYDNMHKEEYWKIFLKTDERFQWMLYFKEYEIEKKEIKHSVTKHLNTKTLLWHDVKQPSEKGIIDGNSRYPYINFIPPKEWKKYSIGMIGKGQMSFALPETRPFYLLTFYKNGKIIYNYSLIIGNRIDELNTLTSFTIDYKHPKKYSDVDSISVLITKGTDPITLKNNSFSFCAIKKIKK